MTETGRAFRVLDLTTTLGGAYAAHLLLEPGGGCLRVRPASAEVSWPLRFPAGLPIEVGATNPSDRGGRRLVRIEWSDMRLHLDDPSVAGALVAYLNAADAARIRDILDQL